MLALVRISGGFDMKGGDSLCVGQHSLTGAAKTEQSFNLRYFGEQYN